MVTMTISLPEQMKQWIERQVEGGSYSSTSDYMRDLVRRDRDSRASERVYSIEELRDVLAEARADRSDGMTLGQIREIGRRVARENGWINADS